METQIIKYTTDRRKVVVLGDLNSTEKIVRELYVTEDGKEFSGGEKFVVKSESLLDNPSKTWREVNLEDIKLEFDKERAIWDNRINSLITEKKSIYHSLKDRVEWLKNVAKDSGRESLTHALSTIADFLSADEKWILVYNYGKYELEKFDDNGISKLIGRCGGDDYYYEMRLLSLFGKTNGDFEFGLNTYSDYEGQFNKVSFFKSKKEALDFMQKEIDGKEEYNGSDIDNIDTYNLNKDPKKYNKYQNGIINIISNEIKELKQGIEEKEKKCKELKMKCIN